MGVRQGRVCTAQPVWCEQESCNTNCHHDLLQFNSYVGVLINSHETDHFQITRECLQAMRVPKYFSDSLQHIAFCKLCTALKASGRMFRRRVALERTGYGVRAQPRLRVRLGYTGCVQVLLHSQNTRALHGRPQQVRPKGARLTFSWTRWQYARRLTGHQGGVKGALQPARHVQKQVLHVMQGVIHKAPAWHAGEL